MPHPPSLGFLGGQGQSRVSAPGGAQCSPSKPGARPLSRNGLRANQPRVMPRRETTVAGNQGQGSGHNGAIVGLQSVDFQAAVLHPPFLLLPIPAPCQEVIQTHCLLFSLRPKEAAFRILPQTREAGRPRAWSVTSTRWRQSTALLRAGGEAGAGADLGEGGPSTSCFIQKTKSDYIFPHLYSETTGTWSLKANGKTAVNNSTFLDGEESRTETSLLWKS